jgi:hypothetical protein
MAAAPIILFVGVSIFGGGGSAAPTPGRDQIEAIEAKMRMPDDAPAPLSRYQRYYAWTTDNGKKYVYAVYIFDGLISPPPGQGSEHIHRVLETEIPNVTNGGCGVITFYVSPHADHSPSLLCNAIGPATFSKN